MITTYIIRDGKPEPEVSTWNDIEDMRRACGADPSIEFLAVLSWRRWGEEDWPTVTVMIGEYFEQHYKDAKRYIEANLAIPRIPTAPE